MEFSFNPKKMLASVFKKNMLGGSNNSLGYAALPANLGSLLGFGHFGAGTATQALQIYHNSSAVSVPVDWISEAFSLITPVLENIDTGEIISQHPILDLLAKPSPYFTRELFLETIGKNFLITGEEYIIAIGNINRPPIQLQPITPSHMTVVRGTNSFPAKMIVADTTLPGGYSAQRKGTQVRFIRDNLTEIAQVRSYNSRHNGLLRGESPLVGVASEARQNVLGGEHNVSLLSRGGTMSLLFHFQEDMDDDDFQVVKKSIRDQYGGSANAGQIGVTAGENPMQVHNLGSSNIDMDFASLMKMSQHVVAGKYRFPLALIDNSASTMNNLETSLLQLYDNAVLPLAAKIFGGLSDMLLPRYGEDPTTFRIIPDVDRIPALVTRRNEELKLRKDIGIETVNELRKFLPARFDVEGGNEIFIPATMVPLGAASDPQESAEDIVIPSEVP